MEKSKCLQNFNCPRLQRQIATEAQWQWPLPPTALQRRQKKWIGVRVKVILVFQSQSHLGNSLFTGARIHYCRTANLSPIIKLEQSEGCNRGEAISRCIHYTSERFTELHHLLQKSNHTLERAILHYLYCYIASPLRILFLGSIVQRLPLASLTHDLR